MQRKDIFRTDIFISIKNIVKMNIKYILFFFPFYIVCIEQQIKIFFQ